jgi:hypothetical protein
MQQSFKNGETCPAEGRYYCDSHYRTSRVVLKQGDVFPNCKNDWGHGSGTIWLNYDPEEEDWKEKEKRKLGR